MNRDHPTLAAFINGKGKFTESGSAVCPTCGAVATFRPAGDVNCRSVTPVLFGDIRGQNVFIRVGVCAACGGGVIVALEINPQGVTEIARLIWPPQGWPDNAPDDLDGDIRRDYDEARAVLAHSPRAAALLARRCLQHVLRKELAIKKRTLKAEIEATLECNEFSQPTRLAMEHIRALGNLSAHPETAEADDSVSGADPSTALIDVSREEAEYMLDALEMVFNDIYFARARHKAMEAKIARLRGKAD